MYKYLFIVLIAGLIAGCSTTSNESRTSISSIQELNTVALNESVVFLVLTESNHDLSKEYNSALNKAAETLKTEGAKVGIFSLDSTSVDHKAISKEATLPCIVALMQGGALKIIDGELTEKKLVETVYSMVNGGVCSSGGCSSGGCGTQ